MSTTTRVTYDQFDEMIQRGDFADTDDRFELLSGEITLIPLPEPLHEFVVDVLNEWGFQALPAGAAGPRPADLGHPRAR